MRHLTGRRSLLVLVAMVAVAFAVAGCAGDTPSSGPIVRDPIVTIRDLEFQPADVTVESGTEVEWVWADGSIRHDVAGPGFESPLQTNGTFTHVFEDTGIFRYTCTIHPHMTGTVTVVDEAGPDRQGE